MKENEPEESSIKIQCPRCDSQFDPKHNKASLWQGITTGIVAGGASGGAIGAKTGVGTGITTGGTGFAGMPVFIAVGAFSGACIGGVSGAWYRDKRLNCPSCNKTFRNPYS